MQEGTKSIPYKISYPKGTKTNILLSIPHCGTAFPEEIMNHYKTSKIIQPDDTDWYLEKLYDFANELGITVIEAIYSRWVIDLNRTPENKSLYDDGRIITSLCPVTDFKGDPLYISAQHEPTNKEIQRRLHKYYEPYHEKIDLILDELRNEFGNVLFWDAHSIRRNVSTIQKDDFPDLILGNNDGKTASSKIIENALNSLQKSNLTVKHNHPFKGGFLTRSKGDPENNIHALQLEMSKDLYMSNNEMNYDESKSIEVKKSLIKTFKNLIQLMNE
ncbi:N-formylglutamate amidohydrolase [Crocinitomicaceae bacterium]|nr:N-formylglutamate amidohydrolase [Crocinitomicaceae bacterium]